MGCNNSKQASGEAIPKLSTNVDGPISHMKEKKSVNKLRILHFNDVYNIQENPKKAYKGGAARFVTGMQHYQEKARSEGVDCLTVFSGDLLSPSLISSMFEGEQMVPSFNKCNVEVACIGNHDLDFGIEQMDKVLKQTMQPEGNCQWIMSNLVPQDKP